MTDEQGKPAKKWYKTLSGIIFIMLPLGIVIAFIVVLSTTSVYQTTDGGDGGAYLSVRNEFENAVAVYSSYHNGSLPTLNGTYTIEGWSTCSVINISALLVANGGFIKTAPPGLALVDPGMDNCNGNKSLGCATDHHYVWIVDTNVSIHANYTYNTICSICVGKGCEAYNQDGYQGVWP